MSKRPFVCFAALRGQHQRVYASIIVPVYSVNAHNEGLYIRVGRATELAAGLSAERGAITQCEMVQRADSGAMGHHCWVEHTHTPTHRGRGKHSV